MFHRFSLRQTGIFWMGLLIGMAIFGGGCYKPAEQLHQRMGMLGDPELDRIVRLNVNAIGGIELWAKAVRIDADAMVTIMGEDGGKTLVEQKHTFGYGKNPFTTITSRESEGTLVESINSKGQVEMLTYAGDELLRQEDQETLYGTDIKLRLMTQAMTGGIGLLHSRYRMRYMGTERQGGRLMYKLEVEPVLKKTKNWLQKRQASEVLVVWIDTQTNLAEKMWLRFIKDDTNAYGYLAVNITRFEKTSEGYTLPRYMELVRSNQYMQFSDHPIMMAEYQRVIVTQLPAK